MGSLDRKCWTHPVLCHSLLGRPNPDLHLLDLLPLQDRSFSQTLPLPSGPPDPGFYGKELAPNHPTQNAPNCCKLGSDTCGLRSSWVSELVAPCMSEISSSAPTDVTFPLHSAQPDDELAPQATNKPERTKTACEPAILQRTRAACALNQKSLPENNLPLLLTMW